jgi:glycosyltransferase involved in cell wall biosynthesis/tetratricopeptide (TPR) repeat protein
MRAACCAIVYDTDPDHKKVRAMLESTQRAGTTDWVIGVDAKSLPDTEQFIRDILGPEATVYPFTFEDDFGAARNTTLAHLPEGIDFWYWIDADDTLEMPGGKTIIEFLEALDPRAGVVFFPYDYEHDSFGNQTTTHLRGRFYRTAIGWEWKDRVHEDCYPLDWEEVTSTVTDVDENGVEFSYPHTSKYPVRPVEHGVMSSEDFLWVHDTTDRGSAGPRNLKLLRMMLEENPDNPRVWYSLGNQFFATGEFRKCVEAYERYVSMSTWDEEKWAALIYLGIAYRALGMMDKSIQADTRAMHLLPKLADSYFGLGETYTRLQDWAKGKHFGELGIQRVISGDGIPSPVVFYNSNAYAFKPYTWLAVCYYNLGERETAVAAYEKAIASRPEPELVKTLDHLKWSMSRDRIINNGLDLAAGLLRRNEPLKAKAILENLPAGTSDTTNVGMALAEINRRLAHLYDKTAYENLYFSEEETNDPFLDDAIVERDLPRMAWVLRRLKANGVKKVLDIGIGNGVADFYMARNGIEVVGIDVDRRRVKDGNWNAVKAGFMGTKEHTFEGDEEEEPVTVTLPAMTGPVQFFYCQLGDLTQEVIDRGPYDAVIAAELIEHVADPDLLLTQCEAIAPLVLLTTPDGAYDGPQKPNLGHVIAWSQREFTQMIVRRGQINEVHKIAYAPGEQSNIVCEYVAGAKRSAPQVDVIIWCPNTGQDWTPDSIRQGGIGGSETAVIRVAEELAKQGKLVTVYAECEGMWGGVRYAHTEDFRPQPCGLFVAWRNYGPTAQMKGLAQRRLIWAHDIHVGPITEEQLEGVTILALSQWHEEFLKSQYPTADIEITGNGIDPERFRQHVDRIPHRLIYASSPDRGLDLVLKSFPRIRAKYPDATLEVFYGFEMARKRVPEYIAMVEELAQQPGVTLHGRVGQDRLAEEYLKADAMIYPAVEPSGQPFNETYCISVVEALAAGCFPVTGDHGALRYTNQGGAFYRHPVWEDAIKQLFAFWDRPVKIQKRIRDHGHEGKDATVLSGRRWALEQTWEQVARGWIDLLGESANSESSDPSSLGLAS